MVPMDLHPCKLIQGQIYNLGNLCLYFCQDTYARIVGEKIQCFTDTVFAWMNMEVCVSKIRKPTSTPPKHAAPTGKWFLLVQQKHTKNKNPTGNLGPLIGPPGTEVWTNGSWARVSKRVPKPMSPSHCVLGILGGHGGKEVGGWERFSGRKSRLDISSIKSLSAPTVFFGRVHVMQIYVLNIDVYYIYIHLLVRLSILTYIVQYYIPVKVWV